MSRSFYFSHTLAALCLAAVLCAQAPAADFPRKGDFTPLDEGGFGTASETFSVFAIPQADHLKLLLERFGVAQAITGARIRLHSIDRQSAASEVGDGVYRADDAWLLEPGKKALAVTIESAQEHDVLVIVFDPAQGGPAAARRDPKYGPRASESEPQ